MLITLCLMPFIAALLLILMPGLSRRNAALIAGAAALGAVGLLFAMLPEVLAGQVIRFNAPWLDSIGLALSLRVDGYAWMFAFIVTGIGSLIVLYAHYYLDPKDPPVKFFAFLMIFMGAMQGITISGNLLLLLIFWELTSISSFLLIGFWRDRTEARNGARMALTITGGGGLCLLAGILLIGHIVGSYELDVVLKSGALIKAHELYVPALVLVLLGAFAKSAQFPFHFWLPHAMAAPTPVSAYLHSATMVKAGVFLLARMYPALAGTDEWFYIVSTIGLSTLCIGAFLAIFQQDLKGLLAYSTISHLGLITLLFGLATPMSVVAGVFHIINHATFKCSLFMAAGIIDHETGTRDFRKLNGLFKYMPITGILAIVASLSMAGVPLFNGFLSKEMFLSETLSVQGENWVSLMIPGLATFAGLCAVAYSLRFIHEVFFNGEPKGIEGTPHEPPRFMRVPVEVLVVLCLAVGFFPTLVVGPLLSIGAQGVLQAGLPQYELAQWHGFNAALVMSLISLLGGLALYWYLHTRSEVIREHRDSRAKKVFEWQLTWLLFVAKKVTRNLESGKLQNYLLVLFAVVITVAAWPFWQAGLGDLPVPQWRELPWVGMALAAMTCVASLAVLRFYQRRIIAVILIGVVGLGVSAGFVLLSAPDLALTQLLVEVVSVLLLLLALRYLPQESPPEKSKMRQWFDGSVAIAAGSGMSVLVYAVMSQPSRSISEFFLATAKTQGGGSNVVNVILVDYRGFDTLGEITVVAIAALIIYALLYQAESRPFTTDKPSAQRSLLLRLISQLLLPLVIAVSVYLYMRGHNLPGGGFIAALVLAIAFILQYVAVGVEVGDRQLNIDWHRLIGFGLLAALITGFGSFYWGYPFLTSSSPHFHLPLLGDVHLPSAVGFDTGVYFTVAGGIMLALVMLSRLSYGEANKERD